MSGWNSDQDPLTGKLAAEEQGHLGDRKAWLAIEKVLMANTTELKRQHRWKLVFRFITFVYLGAFLLFLFRGSEFDANKIRPGTGDHMAAVAIRGLIAEGQEADARRIIPALEEAFAHKDSRAVVLVINSPGGSPVQSDLIFRAVRDLSRQHDKPVYAVVGETGASGAYYIAAAADQIFVHGSSLVGSIGVTSSGFGFDRLLDNWGIERRSFTAGENKGFLDPFAPLRPEEQEHMQAVLANVHKQFIDAVLEGRGGRLQAPVSELATGLIWSGEQAVELGLADELLSLRQLSVREDLPVVDFSRRLSPFEQWMDTLGVSIGRGLSQALLQQGWY